MKATITCIKARQKDDNDQYFFDAIHEHVLYMPLISRVRGPYGKLWTEFFPSFYGPSAKREGHENKEGKNEDL